MELKTVIKKLQVINEKIKIMEVCGTHTYAIHKNAINNLISPNIKLVSGPGCPVCVTPTRAIDELIEYSFKENHTVLSFGDMFRVTGSKNSLWEAKTMGGHTHLMYSPFEVIEMAKKNKDHQYIIAAVGFETTVPIYAALLEQLIKENLKNVKFYTALKTMPEILDYICMNETVDAFLCPGHVSVIIGSNSYKKLYETYKKPFVISGFEAEHILIAIYEIIRQKQTNRHNVTNLYKSVVTKKGQLKALNLINKYFVKSDASWRGIGLIKNSGYILREEFSDFNANYKNALIYDEENVNDKCRCTDVILGRIAPNECPLFQKVCNPDNPVGACMVSSEGTCRIWNDNYLVK